jgi:hypothetical protein
MKVIKFNIHLVLFFGFLVIFLGCGKSDLSNTPPCLTKTIYFINTYIGRCPATIVEYEFQNKIVYYVDPGSCSEDQEFLILNSNCDTIGYLAGFAGNSIINGEDFYRKARILRAVWTN